MSPWGFWTTGLIVNIFVLAWTIFGVRVQDWWRCGDQARACHESPGHKGRDTVNTLHGQSLESWRPGRGPSRLPGPHTTSTQAGQLSIRGHYSDQSDQTWLCLCTNRCAYTNRLAGTNQLVHINRRGSNYVPHSIASHTLKHTNTIVLIFEWWYVRLSSVLTTFYPILIRCSNSNRKLVMNS